MLVDYSLNERTRVAVVKMNDGKHQAISLEMIEALNAALDRAEADQAGVVLTGNGKSLSAGFHLPTLRRNDKTSEKLIIQGFELSYRMFLYPYPFVVACNGNALALGAFFLLAADYRIGIKGGKGKVGANEVAIGLPVPHLAVELCKLRISRTHLQRCTLLAEVYTTDNSVEPGWLDELVEKGDLMDAALSKAAQLRKYCKEAAFRETKLRMRSKDIMGAALEKDRRHLLSSAL